MVSKWDLSHSETFEEKVVSCEWRDEFHDNGTQWLGLYDRFDIVVAQVELLQSSHLSNKLNVYELISCQDELFQVIQVSYLTKSECPVVRFVIWKVKSLEIATRFEQSRHV